MLGRNLEYNEHTVEKLCQDNLLAAYQLLASLTVAEGRKPTTKGLNGWVFEQTVRYCLAQELTILELSPILKEQVPLYGRTKIDLLVGCVAIEIKARGSFGDDARKYTGYRGKIEERGWVYCYLTLGESYNPYRLATESAFGKERAFFLDTPGDWERFVREIVKNNGEKP